MGSPSNGLENPKTHTFCFQFCSQKRLNEYLEVPTRADAIPHTIRSYTYDCVSCILSSKVYLIKMFHFINSLENILLKL